MVRGTARIAKPWRTCSNTLKCFITAVVVIHRLASCRQPNSCKTGLRPSGQKRRLLNPGPLEGENRGKLMTSPRRLKGQISVLVYCDLSDQRAAEPNYSARRCKVRFTLDKSRPRCVSQPFLRD
jgi:hypothetical protein